MAFDKDATYWCVWKRDFPHTTEWEGRSLLNQKVPMYDLVAVYADKHAANLHAALHVFDTRPDKARDWLSGAPSASRPNMRRSLGEVAVWISPAECDLYGDNREWPVNPTMYRYVVVGTLPAVLQPSALFEVSRMRNRNPLFSATRDGDHYVVTIVLDAVSRDEAVRMAMDCLPGMLVLNGDHRAA